MIDLHLVFYATSSRYVQADFLCYVSKEPLDDPLMKKMHTQSMLLLDFFAFCNRLKEFPYERRKKSQIVVRINRDSVSLGKVYILKAFIIQCLNNLMAKKMYACKLKKVIFDT